MLATRTHARTHARTHTGLNVFQTVMLWYLCADLNVFQTVTLWYLCAGLKVFEAVMLSYFSLYISFRLWCCRSSVPVFCALELSAFVVLRMFVVFEIVSYQQCMPSWFCVSFGLCFRFCVTCSASRLSANTRWQYRERSLAMECSCRQ